MTLFSLFFLLGAKASFSYELESTNKMKREFIKSVAGKYAHFDVVAYHEKMGFSDMKTLVITYGFTTLAVKNGKLTATERFCRAVHKSNQPFQASVPDGFTRSIVPPTAIVDVSSDEYGFSIWRPETPTPVGIKLENPQVDSLPKDPNDPRIFDHDQDGKPGVTVKMKMFGMVKGEIYMARREIFAYKVRLQENGNLVGFVKDSSEQLILGANPWFLNRKSSPPQYPDLSKSPIVLVPVDDSYDCDRLLEERDTLLPPDPEVW